MYSARPKDKTKYKITLSGQTPKQKQGRPKKEKEVVDIVTPSGFIIFKASVPGMYWVPGRQLVKREEAKRIANMIEVKYGKYFRK